MNTTYTIKVYIDNGLVFEYDTNGAYKAYEHAQAIISKGYVHNGNGEFEHYPSHRISKVKVCGNHIPTLFEDRTTGV